MHLPSEVIGGEIFTRTHPELQSLISHKHKEEADKRKYESIQYPISVEEASNADVRSVYNRRGHQ